MPEGENPESPPPEEFPRSIFGWHGDEPWTEPEIIVALAACPPRVQNYDQNRPFVIEVADLIGRSPAAVSMHFGNFFALKKDGEEGLRNVGKLTVEVYRKYKDRPDDLRKDAEEIRTRIYAEAVSPRVESRFAEDRAEQLENYLKEHFPEARLPPGTIILYRRPGSCWVGVLTAVQLALVYPSETRSLFRLVIEALGGGDRKTPAVEHVLREDQDALATAEILRRAPKFHPAQLSASDRITLALQLPRLMSLRDWKPGPRQLETFVGMSTDPEKERVGKYFGIDASGLCNGCLMMLQAALDDALARHVL
jgi:hypothetical protein